LCTAKIVSERIAQKMKQAKGMRNIIAHEYGTIDDEIVFETITREIIKDTREFLNELDKNSSKKLKG